MWKRICLPAVLLLAPVTATLAQQRAPLDPGQRLRITAPGLGMEQQAALLERVRGDTLVVTADSTVSVPVTAVTRLEVFRGRSGHAWTGAVIGAGAGAAVGTVTAVLVCESAWCTVDGGVIMAGLGIGILSGGLAGAGVGALIKSDRWEDVPLDRLRVGLAPGPHGASVVISLAF